jgi:ethanolamine utilization protein EutN
MKLAKVTGTVVATKKVDCIKGLKILMIQPLDEKLQPAGGPVAAIDTVQAGYGDLVHYTLAREAALALPQPFAPVDAAITGIVDDVNVEDPGIVNKEEIFEKE